MKRSGRRVTARLVFTLYSLLLVLATHWPQLDLGPAPFNAFDKVVHASAYALWTALLFPCCFFGRAFSGRTTALTLAAALFFAAADEATQAIPVLHRDSDLLDYGADVAGILLALLLIALWRRLASRHTPSKG